MFLTVNQQNFLWRKRLYVKNHHQSCKTSYRQPTTVRSSFSALLENANFIPATLIATQNADTSPKVETQSSTTSTPSCGNATNIVDSSGSQRHIEDEDPIIHNYRMFPIGMTPRSFEGKTAITRRYTRSLENGLKDSSTDELLGYSSSDQGSESEFSNYSY